MEDGEDKHEQQQQEAEEEEGGERQWEVGATLDFLQHLHLRHLAL
jgi:hypothetical protein